jgi:hypothetical protein
MPMSSDDDKQPFYARWRNSNVSRNFHRLGLLVAAIILMAGLLLMAKGCTWPEVLGFDSS